MTRGTLLERTGRPLGDLEKLFWATSLESNINWVQPIQVSGTVNSGDLREALDRLQARHPLLSVSVISDENSVPHFRSSANCPVPLRIVNRTNDLTWIGEAESEINEPMDPARPPLLRAVFVQGEQTSEILLCGTHCNIDGVSIIVIVKDLLLALAKLPGPPTLPLQLPFENLFAPLRGSELPGEWEDNFRRPIEGHSEPKMEMTNAITEVAPPFRIAFWRLDSDHTRKLVESCRKEGVTMHAAVCAAFLSAFGKQSQNSDNRFVRCASPINLREACPPVGEDVGVYISMFVLCMPLDLPTNIWELARSVREQLNQAKKMQNLVTVHTVLREMMNLPTAKEIVEWSRQAVSYEFGVTNLGKLPIPSTFGSLRISRLWPPIAVSNPNSDTVAVFTFEDQLTITITSKADRQEFGTLAINCLKEMSFVPKSFSFGLPISVNDPDT